MGDFDLVRPLISQTWVVEGKEISTPLSDTDAMLIQPLLNKMGTVPRGFGVLHSLVLDNNVMTDIVDNRRPANIDWLMNLLRSRPLELNPVMAMIEQRQKFGRASQALRAYAELLGERFDAWDAKHNVETFDKSLQETKHEIGQNIELLSSYLPAILFIYHQSGEAEAKLEWLGGLIRELDLPFFQLPFYLAALLFLAKEKPKLFRNNFLKKMRDDTSLRGSLDEQKKAILNLGHDVMLPAISIFPSNTAETIVFPYIATRDYFLQDFLCEIRCSAIEILPEGRANGAWELTPNGRLHAELGTAITKYLPRRSSFSSTVEISIRRANLRAFSDSYLQKCVAFKQQSLKK